MSAYHQLIKKIGKKFYQHVDYVHWCATLKHHEFMQAIRSTPEFLYGKNYIDIGCAFGDKVFLMAHLAKIRGGKFVGIDYQKIFKEYWRKLSNRNIKFYQTKAQQFSFKEFDRIYTFNPFGSLIHDIRLAIYKKIWKELPTGAIWLEVAWENWTEHYIKEFTNKYIAINKFTIQKV